MCRISNTFEYFKEKLKTKGVEKKSERRREVYTIFWGSIMLWSIYIAVNGNNKINFLFNYMVSNDEFYFLMPHASTFARKYSFSVGH